jgi:Zn-dependent protease with chaperone function
MGGCVDTTDRDRLDRVCARLASPIHATVRVLGSSEPAAYSWPTGEIFVSRGLLELLDDEELAAAIAHERGHLAAGNGQHGALGLRGRAQGLEAELQADQIGADLLNAAGIPPATMADMLSKVRNGADLQPIYAADMDRRIERLRQTFAPASR